MQLRGEGSRVSWVRALVGSPGWANVGAGRRGLCWREGKRCATAAAKRRAKACREAVRYMGGLDSLYSQKQRDDRSLTGLEMILIPKMVL